MAPALSQPLLLFCQAILLGMAAALLYDLLRAFRLRLPRLTSARAPVERIVSDCLRLLASGPAGGAAETTDASGGNVRAPRVMLAPQLIVRDSSVFRR